MESEVLVILEGYNLDMVSVSLHANSMTLVIFQPTRSRKLDGSFEINEEHYTFSNNPRQHHQIVTSWTMRDRASAQHRELTQ